MATVSAGDKFLVSFVGELLNQRIINTFWYGVESVVGPPNSNDVADALRAALIATGGLRPDFLACVPQNYVLQFIWIQRVDSPRLLKKIYPDSSPGLWAVDTDASNIACTVTRRGDLATKKAIGSVHVPISSDPTAIIAGEISITLNGLFNTFATQVLAPISLSGIANLVPIIRNGPLAVDVNPITSVTVHPEVRTMRRRTLRLGE